MTRFTTAVLVTAGVAASASAQFMVFTDRPSWEAAASGVVFTEDFNSSALVSFADGETIDFGNLEITRDGSANGGDGALAITDGSAFGNIDGTNHLDGETGVDPHETTLFGFNGFNATAFGADFNSPFSGDGVGLEINGELFLIDTIGGFDTGFFGVVAIGTEFSSASIVGNPATDTFQELWQADNISYAQGSLIPTPGAAAVLGLGGLAAMRRRR
ncbi:MAG: hypothetical protein AAF297_03795 [Planctomycetota bacterium]